MTITLKHRPAILAGAAIVGKKEGEGPLNGTFDQVVEDDLFGEESWEKAESRFYYTAATLCLQKAGLTPGQTDVLLGGDLLNQIMSASMAARELHIPFLGLYGACSTMAESLCIGAMLVDAEHVQHALCAVSSHFCSAERQYRFPLEYGNQRPPTAQWTVTGAGATLIAPASDSAICRCTHVTIGQVTDMGIADANNMGAAMAPAAASTLRRHFEDTRRTAADYDLIITGDLGQVGHDILLTLMQEAGHPLLPERYMDCGLAIFDRDRQDVHAGGSGCGCSAVVLNGHILQCFRSGEVRRVLFMATGALLSTTTSQQGSTIPGIAHAIALEADP